MIARIAIAIALAFASPCLAEENLRQIDFTKVLTGPDGPFKECKKQDDAGKCIKQIDLTLGLLCLTAAAMPDRGASLADQVAHGRLAMKLLDAKMMELSSDDVTFLKSQIAKLGYNTMAVYQATRLLDPTVDKP